MSRTRRIGFVLTILFCTFALFACASKQNETIAMGGAFADSETISLKVDGMACRNCANEIAHELKEVPGVKDAVVDFDNKRAIVALDDTNPATRDQLNAAIEHWRVEHFGLEEDPDCLDPQKREEIKREMSGSSGG